MSEADRIFPPRSEKESLASKDGQRFIRATDRKSGQSRSVEVVHVARGTAITGNCSLRAGNRGVRAEAWPDGYRPRQNPPPTLFDTPPPPAPKPTPQVGHLVERKPSALAPLPVQPSPVAPRKARGQPTKERTFADPFVASDTGANCIRCGYLIQPAREQRGKMTCAACG